MAIENSYGFPGLKAMNSSIEMSVAAFCSRAERVSGVIGVSLVPGKASRVEIVRASGEIERECGVARGGILIALRGK